MLFDEVGGRTAECKPESHLQVLFTTCLRLSTVKPSIYVNIDRFSITIYAYAKTIDYIYTIVEPY